MNQADRALLEALGAVSAASPTEWALVTKAVEDAGGIRNVDGMARAEIERAAAIARSLVVKHPGHADQSVHGGSKGKGSKTTTPAPAASSGSSRASSAGSGGMTLDNVGESVNNAQQALGRSKDSMGMALTGRTAEMVSNKHILAQDRMKQAKVELSRAKAAAGTDGSAARTHAKNAREHVREARNQYDSAVRTSGLPIKNSKVRNVLDEAEFALNELIDGGVLKAVEPVVKHPGHGDQSVHGGKKGKGGAAAGKPAASGAGASGAGSMDAATARKTVEQAKKQTINRMQDHARGVVDKVYMDKGPDGKSKVKLDSVDDVELQGISQEMFNAWDSVTLLSPRPKSAAKELTAVANNLNDAILTARGLKNKVAREAATNGLVAMRNEIFALGKLSRETWEKVPASQID